MLNQHLDQESIPLKRFCQEPQMRQGEETGITMPTERTERDSLIATETKYLDNRKPSPKKS